jgi:Ubiquitin carboxyl-terminal hydrolase, family 1
LARGKLLEETSLFAKAHVAAATFGQSVVPSAKDEVDLHFIAFVQALSAENPGERRLVELDGRRQVPLDHGKSEDLLKVIQCPLDSNGTIKRLASFLLYRTLPTFFVINTSRFPVHKTLALLVLDHLEGV